MSAIEFEDRISSLPDGILVHILSLLPTRDAVNTVLIPRFGKLWTSIHSLDFDRCSFHDCDSEDGLNFGDHETCLNFISHAMIFHSRPTIYKFCLKFGFTWSWGYDDHDFQSDLLVKDQKIANEIDMWISFALSKKVQILVIDLLGCEPPDPRESHRLPNFVLSCCFLTELQMFHCEVKPKGNIYMKSLKVLYLREVLLPDKVIEAILDGSPSLEELSLIECCPLRKLNLTSARLRKLVICVRLERNSKLEISCPTVRSLYIAGWLDQVELKNVSAVVDAEILYSYLFRCEEIEYHEVRGILEKLCHAKVFTFCTWSIMVFTIWALKSLPCPSFHWKHLVLQTYLTKWHRHGIASLLRNSPHLESLTIEVCRGTSALPDEQTQWLERYNYDEANFWNMVEPFDCLVNALKSVYIGENEYYGSVMHSHVIQLVKFLLKSSVVMEKIVITTKPDGEPQWTERLREFTKTLSSFPRASSQAVILFV